LTDCTEHKGHRRYVGGRMDGQVSHLVYADPSDYPQTFGTVKRNGQRSWYEIDYEASEGTEAVYRFLGDAPELDGLRDVMPWELRDVPSGWPSGMVRPGGSGVFRGGQNSRAARRFSARSCSAR
jgi:hypothetical protein